MTSRTPTLSLFWEKTHLLFHQIHSKYRNIDIWTSGETKLVVPVQMKTRFKYWSAVAQKMIYKLQRKQSEVRILDLCFLLNLFLLYIPFKGKERKEQILFPEKTVLVGELRISARSHLFIIFILLYIYLSNISVKTKLFLKLC